MDGFRTLLARLRGVRGGEWLAAAVALALLGIVLMNGGLRPSADVRTDLEKRLEGVLSQVEGAGRVRVLVSQRQESVTGVFSAREESAEPEIQGVLVVADGAGDLRVRLALTQAVRALLRVEAANIEIVEMRRD